MTPIRPDKLMTERDKRTPDDDDAFWEHFRQYWQALGFETPKQRLRRERDEARAESKRVRRETQADLDSWTRPMIFGAELIPKVLDGSKTVARRPVKYDDYGNPLDCYYIPGRTYAVQPRIEEGLGKGRGGKAVARIRILSVRRRFLGRASFWTEAEVRREGFSTWPDYVAYWRALHGSYDPTQLVHRIKFLRVEGER